MGMGLQHRPGLGLLPDKPAGWQTLFLAARGVLYLSELGPKVPRGWLLPRDSTMLVAMGTVATDPRSLQPNQAPG